MSILDNITLLTVSYNNNLLTGFMIKSCFKQIGQEIPVCIIDTGKNQKCDNNLKELFNVYDCSNVDLTSSRQHSYAIDYALKNCINTKYVMLCDNDILFKSELNNLLLFLDTFKEIDAVGEIGWDCTPPNRLYPYFCIINVEKFNTEKLNYYDSKRIIKDSKKLNKYDTGYSFYEDIKKNNWDIKTIKMNNFIVHLKSGTLQRKSTLNWLKSHRDLF